MMISTEIRNSAEATPKKIPKNFLLGVEQVGQSGRPAAGRVTNIGTSFKWMKSLTKFGEHEDKACVSDVLNVPCILAAKLAYIDCLIRNFSAREEQHSVDCL